MLSLKPQGGRLRLLTSKLQTVGLLGILINGKRRRI
uniref:Uncharacterized protein n=1 Tax=Fagus sylvatica TaxID=28930 RepID=A0A2N9J991_FAGSY